MNERDVLGCQRGDQRALRQRTHHSAVDEAVVLRHPPRLVPTRLTPRHPRRAPFVLRRAARSHVVRARQVVFGQCREIQDIVVAVLRTFPPRGLVEGIGDEEVRTGQDEPRRMPREPRLPADGSFALRHRLVPVGGDVELVLQVAETFRMGGELPQHREEGSGVQGRQSRHEWRGTWHVVQRCEAGEGILVHLDDPMGVAGRVPVVRVILDAGHGAAAVVVETGIGRGGREEVRDVEERGIGSRAAVDVDAEQRVVIHLRKEPLLVLELKVRPQPRVQRLPKRAALRVVVHAFRMQEARDAGLASDHPRLGDEALVQIRLLAREQRIVLARIQVRLRRLGLLQLRQPRTPQTRMPREGIVAQRTDLRRRMTP